MGFDVDFGIAFHFLQKLRSGEIAAAHTQNTPFGVEQAGGMRLIKAGQQFAHGQIAGCTKQHQIKIRLFTHFSSSI